MSTSPLHGATVVVVNNFAGPGMGGGEVQMLPVLEAWIGSGASVALAVPVGSEFGLEARRLGVEVTELEIGPATVPRVLGVLRSLAAAPHSVLFGTGYFTNLLVRVASRGSAARCVNLVAVQPGSSRADGSSRLDEWSRATADRLTKSAVDQYVAVSSSVGDALVQRGASPSVVRVIHNGVDMAAIARLAERAIPPQAAGRFALCAARLAPVKGVDVLVRALSRADQVRILVAGAGPEEAHLRAMALSLGLGDRVSFLGHSGAVHALMRKAEFVVMPSREEGLPMAALEAGALGRAVIASKVGGLPEVISDQVTGVLVRPDDPGALAAAMQGLWSDPMRASALGEAARQRVGQRFTSARMQAAYVDLVEELVGGDSA